MSKRVDKLLNITVGDLRKEIALEDAETLVKDWLLSWEEQEDTDELYLVDDDYDDEDEDDYWEEDNNEEDEYEEEEDYSSKPGDEELPSQEEEDLAVAIANDIDNGKYTIFAIEGIYSSAIIDRVKYLID